MVIAPTSFLYYTVITPTCFGLLSYLGCSTLIINALYWLTSFFIVFIGSFEMETKWKNIRIQKHYLDSRQAKRNKMSSQCGDMKIPFIKVYLNALMG